jgi:hypothetical protein
MWGKDTKKAAKAHGTKITSGHNSTDIQGLSKIKADFADSLKLTEEDANEATILKYAEKSGQYRGFNGLLKRASKQKLNTARATLQTNQIVWQHATQAAQSELSYEQGTARSY